MARQPAVHPRCGPRGFALAVSLVTLLPLLALGQAPDEEQTTARFQATYIWQAQPAFAAAYTGPNSLSADRERSYTFSATAYLGVRPWRGAEFYWNPEVVQGQPLSHLQGLAGSTNGEAQKGAGSNPTLYQARAFLRQTWGLGGGTEPVGPDQNQLAGTVDRRRVSLTIGNLAVVDVFDRNQYAADPRSRLMNWSFLTHGSFDYAANTRGYSWGAALEWFHDDWAVRAGRFLLPVAPNEQALDWGAARHHGDQAEIEHSHELAQRPGKVRLLVFRNHAVMSRYEDALAAAAATGTTPDLNAVRTRAHNKTGFGLAIEQELHPDLGVWARVNRSDGHSETYAFTTIDNAVAAGVLLKGTGWGRPQDSVALGLARNGLSRVHQRYLAAGGLDFFIGDARLAYRPEQILETYYTLGATKHAWLSLDWQHIRNPAYNADRGPVNVYGMRLHAEF